MDTKVTNCNAPEVLFFGCMARPAAAGHCLYSKRTPNISPYHSHPWGTALDGGLLRAGNSQNVDTTPSNRVVLDQKDGWTAVSFWDRSGDARAASNSAFVVKMPFPDSLTEETVADTVLRLARLQWPEIFARPGFPLPKSNGCRKHVLPIDDGFLTGESITSVDQLHRAQIACPCHPTQDAQDPFLWVHNARDGRETLERRQERLARAREDDSIQHEPITPGWLIVGEDF